MFCRDVFPQLSQLVHFMKTLTLLEEVRSITGLKCFRTENNSQEVLTEQLRWYQ